MYEIDPKFFNDDGSINYEAAEAACHEARAETSRKIVTAFRQILPLAGRALSHMPDDILASPRKPRLS